MRTLRLLAILLSIGSIPSLLAWTFTNAVFVYLALHTLARHGIATPGLTGERTIGEVVALFGSVCAVFMGWVGWAALWWTVRNFSAFIAPTPRWVLAGYLSGALLMGVVVVASRGEVLGKWSLNLSVLGYLAAPALLLALAVFRLWRIRRFYRDAHGNSASGKS